MATLIPEIRVDWRGNGHNSITNDIFETDTSGWSVAAGINAAGTTITRIAGSGYSYHDSINTVAGGRTRCGELVTTGTNGSGVKYVITGTFVSGRTYRFRVQLQSVSGTTAGKITLGSLGTGADRATTTYTLTTSFVTYTVDWTPSGNRTDVQVAIMNNAAAIQTSRIAGAEVYEAIDDIRDDVDFLTIAAGANFEDTSSAPGTATLEVRNYDGKYSRDNGSSSLAGLLTLNRSVLIRARDSALPALYALYGGKMRRLVPDPDTLKAELQFQDALYDIGRAEVSVAASVTRSLSAFRTAILTAAGISATNINLDEDGSETAIPYTGCDQRDALGVLSDVCEASGAIQYIAPRCSSAIGWVYETRGRLDMQGDGVEEMTWSDNLTGLSGYDMTDEAVVNQQRVTANPRVVAFEDTVWTSDQVPFTVDAGTSVTIWASFTDPVFSQAVASTATNTPTVTLTPFSDSAKIVITAGGSASIVTALSITGRAAAAAKTRSVLVEDTASQAPDQYGIRQGRFIDSAFIATQADAQGLGGWIVYRYKSAKPRPTLTLVNRFTPDASHQLVVHIGRRALVVFPRLSISTDVRLRALTHTCELGATQWTSTVDVEEAPVALDIWQLGLSLLDGAQVLGY